MRKSELRQLIKEEVALHENQILAEDTLDKILQPVTTVGTGTAALLATSLGASVAWAILGAILILASPILIGLKFGKKTSGEKDDSPIDPKALLKKIWVALRGVKDVQGNKILPQDIGLDKIEQEIQMYIEKHKLYGNHKGNLTRLKNKIQSDLRTGKARNIAKSYSKYVKHLKDLDAKDAK